MSDDIPLIDLAPWYEGDAEARETLAREVDEALCRLGFLIVTGHRVPPTLTSELRSEARAFFALADEKKHAYRCTVGGRGWIPSGAEANAGADGIETPPDLKESFSSGRDDVPEELAGSVEAAWYAANVWPSECPGLRGRTTEFAQACDGLAGDLLEIFALALGLPARFFTSRCDINPYVVNLNWYPAIEALGTVREGQFRVGQHTDFGTMTILDRQAGYGGLQVRRLDGTWADAPYVPETLTINAGDLLARWTGDRWRSTPHRVLPPPADEPTEELLSLVFFHEANPLTVVETLPSTAAGGKRYEPVEAGAFLRARLSSITVA